MKRFAKLIVALVLFAIASFALAVAAHRLMERPAAHVVFERSEPQLLPCNGPGIDWQTKSVDEWLMDKDHYDINFILNRETGPDQLLP